MKVLITGGAGFIGCNAAKIFSEKGANITILDNLSRKGAIYNLDWLRNNIPFEFSETDIRDSEKVANLIAREKFDAVVHLAGQVAVTTSILKPQEDLEINILGTLNILEAIRKHSPQTIIINASTNKVYGKLSHLVIHEDNLRYVFSNRVGVTENEPLDFYTPYGCSKGAADQYVVDYNRIYGIRSVNFRQSCIYGHRQFGLEDQGWVAWFLIASTLGKPINIFGNGKQVRDLLYVNDLIEAYQLAIANIDSVSGETFNIGGGPENSLSLLEYMEYLAKITGEKMPCLFSDSRLGDQLIYISDISYIQEKLNWSPSVSITDGLKYLYDWVIKNREIFCTLFLEDENLPGDKLPNTKSNSHLL